MRVLALDTTTRPGSAALVDDERIVDERSGDGSRTHGERLPAELLDLLAGRGWPLESVDLFAVASGPGSFTGLRIGIATIQGLAFVRRRPVVAVSALDALAQIGSAGMRAGAYVGAWIDAHRGDVFSGLYRVADAAPFDRRRLVEIDAAAVGEPRATLRRWTAAVDASPLAIIGGGAALYRRTIDDFGQQSIRVLPDVPALAGAIGRMAVRLAHAGAATTTAGVQPLYVRRPDAEIDREKREAAAQSAVPRGT